MKAVDVKKIITIAKMYHQQDKSQQEIADQLDISRPQVSRMLKKAKEMGYVVIDIIDPSDNISRLQREMQETFGLKEVKVVDAETQDSRIIKRVLAKEAANFLGQIVRVGDTIGVGWGTTLEEVAVQLKQKKVDNVIVVQLKGAISHNVNAAYTVESITEFSKKFGAKTVYLPVPSIVDSKQIKDALMTDKHLKRAVELGKKANIAVYSVGYSSEKAFLAQTGYFNLRTLKEMQRKGAVGDICSRFYTIDGQVFDSELNERTLSIELSDLAQKEYSVAISGGEQAAKSILGALRGKFINVLITDVSAAERVLKLNQKL